MKNGFEITGINDVQKVLDEIAPRHARNLMRATVRGVASDIANDAKKAAPKASGNLKKSIKAKSKRSPPDAPVSEVYVQKKAFYWRFIEYGTQAYKKGDKRAGGFGRAKKDMPAQPEKPFIRPAVDKANANIEQTMTQQFGKKLEAALKREAKRNQAKKS